MRRSELHVVAALQLLCAFKQLTAEDWQRNVTDWCPRPSCPCQREDNQPEGYSHFTCKTSEGSIIIEQDATAHWFLQCNNLTEGANASEQVEQLNLSLGEVFFFLIKDCSPASFTILLQSLGVTNIEELHINAKRTKLLIDDETFRNLSDVYPNLKVLEIKNRGVKSISNRSLDGAKSLTSVKISRTGIDKLPGTLLEKLTDLQNLTVFSNRKLSMLPATLFRTNSRLKHLDLSMNGFVSVAAETFEGLNGLNYLDIGSNNFETIPGSLLKSSCDSLQTLLMLYDSCSHVEVDAGGRRRRRPASRPCSRLMPSDLLRNCTKLQVFKYSFTETTEDGRVQFPPDFFQQTTSLREVTLFRAQLSSEILPQLLSPLSEVTRLDLSDNLVQSIEEADIPDGVKELRLAGNPFTCECDVIFQINRLKLTKLVDQNNVFLDNCPSTDETYGESPLSLEEATVSICSSVNAEWMVHLLIALATMTTLLGLALSLVCMSERVRVWMYSHPTLSVCFCKDRRNVRTGGGDVNVTTYDTFISYAEEDSEHAILLADALENSTNDVNVRQLGGRTYKCCLHQRDWKVGDTIQGNIIRSVEKSHRTIILMSKNFLASNWCQREFDEAYRRNKVIVLMLSEDNVSLHSLLELEVNATVKSYVSTYTYVRQGDPNLWKKLAYHLPHKPMPRRSKRTKNVFGFLLGTDKRKNKRNAQELRVYANGSVEGRANGFEASNSLVNREGMVTIVNGNEDRGVSSRLVEETNAYDNLASAV